MDAYRYKEQTIKFLRLLYPNGLPEGSISAFNCEINGVKFRFDFDPKDLMSERAFRTNSITAKEAREITNIANWAKEESIVLPVGFPITEHDMEFLSSLKITV